MNMHQEIKSSPHDRQSADAGQRLQRMLARATLSISAAFVAAALAGFVGQAQAGSKFTLSSPDLSSGSFETKFTLNGFGCNGANVSPALQWSNMPAGTKSLALQVRDRDAPTGSGLWHWAIYNIPPTATGLAQGAGNSSSALPAPAFGGTTDFLDTGVTGANGNYAGPCPPVGDKPHHYVFTLYAVAVDDVQAAAGVPKTGTTALYSFVLNKGLGSKLLGTASFTASYGR
jgi:Raf kinase inhibitor-like YbhB/YbcL family protein